MYSTARVGAGSPPMERVASSRTPAVDNMTDILTHNFPGTFQSLPCYQGQEHEGLGSLHAVIFIYLETRE